MGIHPVYGHQATLDRLAGSIASSRFPQAAIFVGPPGIGKQRVALWAAQGLLCDAGPGRPCGSCLSCKHVGNLSHPDLHWVVPIERPKASDSDRQMAEAQDLLVKTIDERRKKPVYGRLDGMLGHPLASIRLLLSKMSKRPYLGRVKVVILGNAEKLIVQDSSQEAANALLKLLEEPPRDTLIVLTTSQPGAILPTIMSRVTPIRLGRLTDGDVGAFVANEISDPPTGKALDGIVLLAAGSIAAAIERVRSGSAAGGSKADRLLSAAREGAMEWSATAFAQAPWGARGAFSDTLDDLAVKLREMLASGGASEAEMKRLLSALQVVSEIREAAAGNVNPQLATAVLAQDLGELL